MKRSDIWILTISGLTVLILITELVGQLEFGGEVFIINLRYLIYWWIGLLPYVLIKIFFRNSKLFKWLNTEIKI